MAKRNIESWLTDLGLADHARVFADNRIDFDVLGDLGEDNLRELGLALGDRKRLMKAIEYLSAENPPAAPTAEPGAATVLDGERRQVAVLFADIFDFTPLAAERDAEEIHQLLNRFFSATDGVVQNFGGSVDKHIDDVVMAVFGAPVAHTDDPERAVRAALALHDAVAELEPPLRVHIGVAAGQVVASSTGSAAHLEYTVTGESVNLASRLTDLARAGQTLISGAVARRYLGNQGPSVEELNAAAAAFKRIHDVRGGMIAHLVSGEMLIDMADYTAADTPLEIALAMARSMGKGRIELYAMYELARNAMAQGRKQVAEERLDRAFEITKITSIAFHGPRLFALKACFLNDPGARTRALDHGGAIVDQGVNAHNVLWYHRDAIDAGLAMADSALSGSTPMP
ncbi:MAG: adenylate/guanylate cyclase domain-containing protein [Alphaproteobacteria bacterium]